MGVDIIVPSQDYKKIAEFWEEQARLAIADRDNWRRQALEEDETIENLGHIMSANEFQQKALSFATGGGGTLMYSVLGAVEELGELCEKLDFWCEDTEVTKLAAGILREFSKLSKISGKLAKLVRKDWGELNDDTKMSLMMCAIIDNDLVLSELSDIMWMVATMSSHLGFNLQEVLERNVRKLEDRQRRGVIIGNGDKR